MTKQELKRYRLGPAVFWSTGNACGLFEVPSNACASSTYVASLGHGPPASRNSAYTSALLGLVATGATLSLWVRLSHAHYFLALDLHTAVNGVGVLLHVGH